MSPKWAEVLALTLLFVVFGVVGITSLADIERNECLAWKKQGGRNVNFYLVGWQADQCLAAGVSMKGISVRR